MPAHRPVDPYGLPLTTSPAAAAAYADALDRILRVQSGAHEALTRAVELDPGFALAHAALAVLGREWAAPVDVAAELAAAESAVAVAGDERERSFVAVVGELVRAPRRVGAAALARHVDAHPRDAFAVSIAVPTIAFAGVTEVPSDSWALVERLAPAYGSDWWYAGLLAFVRQEQERWDEAAALAERALAEVPSSGHAVHAKAHVHYETGAHAAGLAWLDPWVVSCGRAASFRAHFAWHAALHELALGDVDALVRRYREQLAPPAVTGMRALVDSASILWRAKIGDEWPGEPPIRDVLDTVPGADVERPATAFAAFHAIVALAAAADAGALGRLAGHARAHDDPTMRDVIAPLAGAYLALVEGRAAAAADALAGLRCRLTPVGGSAAQREVVEDTLVFALVGAGRCAEACALLTERLDRRPSPRDSRRLAGLAGVAG